MNYLVASRDEIRDELAKGLSEKTLNKVSEDVLYCVRMICAEIQSTVCSEYKIRFSFSLYGRILKNNLPLIKRCVGFLINESVGMELKACQYLGGGLMEVKVKVLVKKEKANSKRVRGIKIKKNRPRRCKKCGYLDHAGGDKCPNCDESR